VSYSQRVQLAQRRAYRAALVRDAVVTLIALAIGIAIGAGGFTLAEVIQP
jgi:hypothetical protein